MPQPEMRISCKRQRRGGGTMTVKRGRDIDWARFGLRSDGADGGASDEPTGHGGLSSGNPGGDELFHQDLSAKAKPWWSANFFVSEPVLFGTWDGVFTTCMIHLFGVIVFLRSGWIVGNAGVEHALLMVLATVVVCSLAVLAGIGICERCHLESGGLHVLLSHILGVRVGGAAALIYCFGQAVSSALHVMGFAESMGQLLKMEEDPWLQRGIASALVLLLLGINVAGVKWVVRLQFALLIILLMAALDFAVGTFVRYDSEHGVTGYDLATLKNNSFPRYGEGQNWFTVFGVFFPAMTGVFAGINMSDDLRNPVQDVPVGTMAAIGTCLFLYLVFVLGLGSTCQRWALTTDYLIAEKASAIGVMVLSGLYISSMSACLGALYLTPRILQNMANDGILPFSKQLSIGKGPNKVPVVALVLFALVTFLFILAGQVNTLAPLVTIPFLLTYACVEYAYFSMAMTYDIQRRRNERFRQQAAIIRAQATDKTSYGALGDAKVPTSDLDQLFPERVHDKTVIPRDHSSVSTTESPVTSPDEHSSIRSAESRDSNVDQPRDQPASGITDKTHLLAKGRGPWPEISNKSNTWYAKLCNRWIAVLGIFVKLAIMFLVQWGYALASIFLLIFLWLCIGRIKPGAFPGVTEFKLFPWLRNLFLRCIGKKPTDYEQIVVAPACPGVSTMESQLNDENVDYASRHRYHHSTTLQTSSHFQQHSDDSE
ncbi:solute carrier family 12 member 8 isoform X3 [Rhipicephalus sanguineus]|uniref:solute carrier family 12 member 8 isoform X3 n=1 Tax=Rhipicephalus sanguineus TaxID=34632 RepID=UPI0018945C1F|nr:solute carrier family 12 member 8 isoform X3 [Rhipicephalus sanguineus]